MHRTVSSNAFTHELAVLDAAEEWIALGAHLFPSSMAKIPHVKWSTETTTNIALVREWLKRWPDMMLCMACGPSGFVVLDLDIGSEPRGDTWLVEQIRDRGPMPWTRCHVTGSGGSQYIFKARPGVDIRNSAKKIAPNVDVRGNGGMIVLPPSISTKGPYLKIEDGAPLAELSGWLLDVIVAVQPERDGDGGTEPNRERWGRDLMPRAERALKYLDTMDPSVSGKGGHDAAWRAAVALVKGFELPEAVAVECMRHFNARCKPRWSDEDLRHKVKQAANATHSNYASGYLIREAS